MTNVISTPGGLLSTGGMNMDPRMIEATLVAMAFDRKLKKKLPDSVRTSQAHKARKKARNHRKKFN